MVSLAGKRVTVMGLGLHGGALGTITWLQQQRAKITVTDVQTSTALEAVIKKVPVAQEIKWVLGEHREEDFINCDLVIRNPGVPNDSPYLNLARLHSIPIEMDSSLFFEYCPSKNIIGITGSKGKSSTTHAISHLLQLEYPETITVGSDQASPLGLLPMITANSLVVFELSSWRLEGLEPARVSPHTAVVTSLYEDHLNTYPSYEAYVEVKKTIMRYQHTQDRILLNADDEQVKAWEHEAPGTVYWFSLADKIPGEGIYVKRGIITVELARGQTKLFSLEDLQLKSEHERRNVLPAILLGFLAGLRLDSIKLNMSNLSGLAHRLERVKVVDGVTYINDSAATIPEATIAGLQSVQKNHIVLILGGSDKRLRFEKLAQALPNFKIRSLIFLPGDATIRMKQYIEGEYHSPPTMHMAATMNQAVIMAKTAARAGDIVLLSPAATSFGLFKHEFDRGDQFKAAVEAL